MRRFVITSAATASGVVLLLSLKPHSAVTASNTPISSGGSQQGTGSSASTASPEGPSAAPSGGSGSSSSGSSSGTVTGDAADTQFGPIQVKITVKNKKITDVSVVEYPSDTPRDQMINSYALPVLNQEAMSAQSAQIDAVSGATYTSEGYIQSLQSAIDKAKL